MLLQGALVGLLLGTAAFGNASVLALLGRITAVPSRERLRLPAADRRIGRRRVRAFLVRFGLMLLAGTALGVAYAWVLALLDSLAYRGRRRQSRGWPRRRSGKLTARLRTLSSQVPSLNHHRPFGSVLTAW
ncbi:hypothetical protein [Streptomyces sp. NPDC001933]|uniref:hypothetical protein n=1 Tax=Streptomyces sp. NPDC001933 TaxID=3364626 RepID=UPI0036C1281B